MTAAPATPCIVDAASVVALCGAVADSTIERAVVLYLDPEWMLLGRSDFSGTVAAIAPPFRIILSEALRLDAAALVLAHNHPGGVATPSAADLGYTRDLIRIAAAVDIAVVDHLILTADRAVSLHDGGWM